MLYIWDLLPIEYRKPCLDCESKGTFQSYAGSINKVYPILTMNLLLGALATMAAGGVGGIALWTVIFPVDVIKSRVQASSQQNTANFVTQMTDIVKKEGEYSYLNRNKIQPNLFKFM
jgi:Mitochondrial carrier protein.